MSEIERGKPGRFQFSLRAMLLWTAVVALGLGLLSAMESTPVGWTVLVGWFATVLVVRLGFGTKRAETTSVVIGMLLFAWAYLQLRPSRHVAEAILSVLASGLIGGLVGLWPFALVEVALRLVNWLARLADG